MRIIEITHVDEDGNDGEVVYCRGVESGMETVKSCLRRGEQVKINLVEMSKTEFDSLDEYNGEC